MRGILHVPRFCRKKGGRKAGGRKARRYAFAQNPNTPHEIAS